MGRNAKKKLLEPMDCMASALAINCCQFGCGIQDIPEAEYGCENNGWMTRLTQIAPDKALRDTIIPGTHDSATCTIPKSALFSASGRTQNGNDITDQLNRGARYLDLRVGGKGSDKESVYIYHSILSGAKFVDILDSIVKFVSDNPGEFLFLEIVLEYGREITDEQRTFLFDTIKTSLGDSMITKEDTDDWFRTGSVTLGQLSEHKKNYMVLVHNRIYNDTFTKQHIENTYSFFNNGRNMRNKWHNTRDVQQLLKSNDEDLEKFATKRNLFLNNSFVLTPGVNGAGDILNLLVGSASLRPVSFARALFKRDVLDNHLREKADEDWNMVTFDFIDLCPALISFLIGLNFPVKLEILRAAAKPYGGAAVDVTDRVQSFVKRDRALFLLDIQDDLGLDFDEGKLTLAFKLDNGECDVHEMFFEEDTEVCVSFYSQNEGALVKLDVGIEPEGAVCGGARHPRGDCKGLKEKNDTPVLEYFTEGGDVKFKLV